MPLHWCSRPTDPGRRVSIPCSRNIATASVTVSATACAENGGQATASASGQAQATAVAEAATQTYAAAFAALQQCTQAPPPTTGTTPAPAASPANLQCIILQVRRAGGQPARCGWVCLHAEQDQPLGAFCSLLRRTPTWMATWCSEWGAWPARACMKCLPPAGSRNACTLHCEMRP